MLAQMLATSLSLNQEIIRISWTMKHTHVTLGLLSASAVLGQKKPYDACLAIASFSVSSSSRNTSRFQRLVQFFSVSRWKHFIASLKKAMEYFELGAESNLKLKTIYTIMSDTPSKSFSRVVIYQYRLKHKC